MDSENRGFMPHWIFWLIGSAIIVFSILTNLIEGKTWSILSDISLNVGITVVAVSIIDWIWRRVGGDPLTNAIHELRSATALLADLRDTGLKRLFISREHASDMRQYFKSKIAQAYEVDMMGIALRSGWLSDPKFQKILEKSILSGETQFRIMILEPEAQVTSQRAFEEDHRSSSRISENAGETLRILMEIKNRLPEAKHESLDVKVIDKTNIYCSVIRVDDQMLVTKYFMHLSGGNSETLEIEGEDSIFFLFYLDEFNSMWNRAASWPKRTAEI